MTLIEQAKQSMIEHQIKEEADKIAAEQQRIAKALKEDVAAQTWAEKSMDSCRTQILEAASKGRDKCFFGVSSFENDYSDWTHKRVKALTALLVAESFNVKTDIDTMEPCGSDSLFNTTVVSTSLIISW